MEASDAARLAELRKWHKDNKVVPQPSESLGGSSNQEIIAKALEDITTDGSYNIECKVLEKDMTSDNVLVLAIVDGTLQPILDCYKVKITVTDPPEPFKQLRVSSLVMLENVNAKKDATLCFTMSGPDCKCEILEGNDPRAVQLKRRIQQMNETLASAPVNMAEELLCANFTQNTPKKSQEENNCAGNEMEVIISSNQNTNSASEEVHKNIIIPESSRSSSMTPKKTLKRKYPLSPSITSSNQSQNDSEGQTLNELLRGTNESFAITSSNQLLSQDSTVQAIEELLLCMTVGSPHLNERNQEPVASKQLENDRPLRILPTVSEKMENMEQSSEQNDLITSSQVVDRTKSVGNSLQNNSLQISDCVINQPRDDRDNHTLESHEQMCDTYNSHPLQYHEIESTRAECQDKVREKCREQMRVQHQEQVRAENREQIRAECQEQIKVYREQMRAESREQVRAYREEMRAYREQMRAEYQEQMRYREQARAEEERDALCTDRKKPDNSESNAPESEEERDALCTDGRKPDDNERNVAQPVSEEERDALCTDRRKRDDNERNVAQPVSEEEKDALCTDRRKRDDNERNVAKPVSEEERVVLCTDGRESKDNERHVLPQDICTENMDAVLCRSKSNTDRRESNNIERTDSLMSIDSHYWDKIDDRGHVKCSAQKSTKNDGSLEIEIDFHGKNFQGRSIIQHKCDTQVATRVEDSLRSTNHEEENVTEDDGDIDDAMQTDLAEFPHRHSHIASIEDYTKFASGTSRQGGWRECGFSCVKEYLGEDCLVKGWLSRVEPPLYDTFPLNDIISGVCSKCSAVCSFMGLDYNQDTRTAFCSDCQQKGIRRKMELKFMLLLHLQDSNGDKLIVTVADHSASEFLGCSVIAYLEDEHTYHRINNMLGRIISPPDKRVPMLKLIVTALETRAGAVNYFVHDTHMFIKM